MKKFTSLALALILFILLATACSHSSNSNELATTPSNYLLTPGVVCEVDGGFAGIFSYEILPEYAGDKLSVVKEAEDLVRKWWNDDSTFRTPEIVWVTILSGDIRGFQDTGYIFLDPNTSYEDLLATAVHEWLHELVDPDTLIDMETGWGRLIMEYIVESITIEILENIVEVQPSYCYNNLKDSILSDHLSQLQYAFRSEKGLEAYEEIFGQDYKQILTKVMVENS